MALRESLATYIPAKVRTLHADLVAVAVCSLFTVVIVFAPVVSQTPLRFVVGVPFVLFLPGYALVSALFPADTDSEQPTTETDTTLPGRVSAHAELDGPERAALAFATSIAVTPMLGVGLSLTPWGLQPSTVVGAIAGFTLGAVAVAAHRRRALPADDQFSVPYRTWLSTGRERLFQTDSRRETLLTVAVAGSLLLAVGSLSVAVAMPPDGEQFSELYIQTENADGELVTDGYPQTLVAGEPEQLVVGIENEEGEQTEYTVVVEMHAVTEHEEHQLRVDDREQLDTLETTLDDGETWQEAHTVEPTLTGEDLRLTYLLYRGEPPAEPTEETAYRSVHLWVTVEDESLD